jgi:restriction system protein
MPCRPIRPYRLAWARTYLKGMGLLTNSQRGVWSLTDAGSALLDDTALTDVARNEVVQRLRAEYLERLRLARRDRAGSPDESPDDADDESSEPTWKESLLDTVMAMSADGFERLARRLLREADFDTVNVTGGSGDGGIDGMDVYRLGLVSFPVFFLVQAIPGQRRGGGRQRLSWGDGRAR